MQEFRESAPRQHVYILRIWETRSEQTDAPATWHCSAQDPQTGERRGFASLEGLMDFLAGRTGQTGYRRGRLSPLPLLEVASAGAGGAGREAKESGGGPAGERGSDQAQPTRSRV
jgi:hypothetical protein